MVTMVHTGTANLQRRDLARFTRGCRKGIAGKRLPRI